MEWERFRSNRLVCHDCNINGTPVHLEIDVYMKGMLIQCKYPSSENRMVAGGDVLTMRCLYPLPPPPGIPPIEESTQRFAEPGKGRSLDDLARDAEAILNDKDITGAIDGLHSELFGKP